MKKNIKIKVNPEQSRLIQEICFKNGNTWGQKPHTEPKHLDCKYLTISDSYIHWLNDDGEFYDADKKEVSAELFIRTDGTCEESKDSDRRELAAEFVQFLWEHGAKTKFCKNSKEFKDSNCALLLDFIDESNVHPESWMTDMATAFYWLESPEKFNYWDDLNKKWLEKLRIILNPTKNCISRITDIKDEIHEHKINTFINFLKDKNALDNFLEEGSYIDVSFLEEYLKNNPNVEPEEWIADVDVSFDWRCTKLSYTFWANLNKEWQEKLLQKYTINSKNEANEKTEELENDYLNIDEVFTAFTEFTLEENCALAYWNNSVCRGNYMSSRKKFLAKYPPEVWFTNSEASFDWNTSPEGRGYWLRLDMEWQKRLEELKQLKAIKDCVSPVMSIEDEIRSYDINTFINFLKDKNVYKEYLYESKYTDKDRLINYLKNTDVGKENWINDTEVAFDWRYTTSGHAHWQQISRQWKDLVTAEDKTIETLKQKDEKVHTKKASKIILKMFDDYLIKHNCYDEYWDLNKHCIGMTYEELRVHFGQVEPHRWLNQASISFAWSSFDYKNNALWCKMNSGWEDICYRYQEELEGRKEKKMKKDITVADLNKYLRQALCFTSYWNNHEELSELSDIDEAEEYFSENSSSQWINCAFNWEDTKEGEEYWEDIHNDWIAWLDIYHSETGVEEPTTNLCTEVTVPQKEIKTKENNMTRRVVTFNLIDNDKGLEAKDALVATYKDVLIEDGTDTAIQQLLMDKDVKGKIKDHNEKRSKIVDKDIRNRTGNEVMLQPIQLKDLTWEVK